MRPASDIEPRAVRWLWRDRIPVAMLSMFAGRPGAGKSLVAMLAAAEVSKTDNVIYLDGEQPAAEVLRPRLEEAGAVLDRVHIETDWRFPDDLDKLEEAAAKLDVKLIVFDPIASLLNAGVRRTDDSIRAVSSPLARLAERLDLSVLIIDHVLKSFTRGSDPFLAIGGGSSGLPAATRAAYIVGRDDQNADRLILAAVKSLEQTPLALGFELDAGVFFDSRGREGCAAALVPEDDPFPYSAGRLLIGESTGSKGRPAHQREEVATWLTGYLYAAPDHERPSKEVEEDARHCGFTKKTLQRAADEIEVVKTQREKAHHWKLPDALVTILDKQESNND
ncbi:MAG TPA: AAA family ATPase [Solirubrobacteraceae bacterium]|nr:AAA family ATPase [Solirubrobacteraceae bacterium]